MAKILLVEDNELNRDDFDTKPIELERLLVKIEGLL